MALLLDQKYTLLHLSSCLIETIKPEKNTLLTISEMHIIGFGKIRIKKQKYYRGGIMATKLQDSLTEQ